MSTTKYKSIPFSTRYTVHVDLCANYMHMSLCLHFIPKSILSLSLPSSSFVHVSYVAMHTLCLNFQGFMADCSFLDGAVAC